MGLDFYPHVMEEIQDVPLKFRCQNGDLILFSGAHLHATHAITSDYSRFSLDFRTVNIHDHAKGYGGPDPDNESQGSALEDYKILTV